MSGIGWGSGKGAGTDSREDRGRERRKCELFCVCLFCGSISKSTIFQSCLDGATTCLIFTSVNELLKGTTRHPSGVLDSESDALPLGHHAPPKFFWFIIIRIPLISSFRIL